MKVYPEKLAASLGKSIAPIYIVSGDEPLLVQESCDLIRNTLRSSGYSERDLFHVEAGFDWEQVLFSANSMSLFADRKILEIRMPNGRPGDKGAVALREYTDNPPEGTVMLVVTGRLDGNIQRSKWFKALESAGVFVQVRPIDAAHLPRWIKERFNRAGLEVTRQAVGMVADRIEGNLLAAVQEIERLSLTTESRQIDVDDVVESVADSSRYDVFTLIDTAVGGDAARTLKISQGLRAEGTETLYVVAMLAREIRNLAAMADKVARGQSLDAAMKSAGVWQRRKQLMSRALKRHGPGAFEQMLRGLVQVDQMVKGLAPGDPWTGLTDVLLHLAGKPVLHRRAMAL